MKRGLMNRKGDVTITTIILIVLGLAVLVFLVIGLTQGWDVFFGTITTVDPGDLQVLAKACIGYANADLEISFCDFKKVNAGGNDEYLNCLDGRMSKTIEDGITVDKPKCPNDVYTAFCSGNTISSGKWDKTKVNGEHCASRTKKNYIDLHPAAVTRSTGSCKPATTNSKFDCAKIILQANVQSCPHQCTYTNPVAPSTVGTCSGSVECNTLIGTDGEASCRLTGSGCTWS